MKRVKIYALFLILLLAVSTAHAIHDRIVESENYRMTVPSTWQVKKEIGPGPEFAFQITDWRSWDTVDEQMLPKTYNNEPVLAAGFIVGVRGEDLAAATKLVTERSRSLPDRKFEKEKTEVETFTLKSGHKAAIVKTRSTRMSSKIQQTRYDLIVFSEKAGHAYNLAFLFNYKDPKFELETARQLDERIREIFATFELKS